jgi:hypothetical protein
LDELALDVSDLQPYLAPFIDHPHFHHVRGLFVYPKIACLTVADQSEGSLGVVSGFAIVEFAKSLHTCGVPFERVKFQMKVPPRR